MNVSKKTTQMKGKKSEMNMDTKIYDKKDNDTRGDTYQRRQQQDKYDEKSNRINTV